VGGIYLASLIGLATDSYFNGRLQDLAEQRKLDLRKSPTAKMVFDVIIIDEAGLADILSVLIALQYLKPGERSGHDIALSVSINCPAGIEQLQSTSHATLVQRPTQTQAVVALAPSDTLPNKDFVLRYRVAGEQVKSGMIVHQEGNGGYFGLMVYPPLELKQKTRPPLEMVFLLDSSFFVFAMALTTYIGRLTTPQEKTLTLSMGVAMNHIASVSMPLVGGILWNYLGYQWTFVGGAFAAAVSIFVAMRVPKEIRRVETSPARQEVLAQEM
jgi:hypothetical protein